MEKCALTMYVSMRKKDIRQNLISKGMLPVRNSISGQQSAATVSFWGLTFSIVMLPVCLPPDAE